MLIIIDKEPDNILSDDQAIVVVINREKSFTNGGEFADYFLFHPVLSTLYVLFLISIKLPLYREEELIFQGNLTVLQVLRVSSVSPSNRS